MGAVEFRFHYSASEITKQQSFLKGVEAYGIPSRVKSGKGKENVLVAGYMIEKRCSQRRSMITGPSTHNQRIARLWRDVFDRVLALYYELFTFMENNELLQLDSNPEPLSS